MFKRLRGVVVGRFHTGVLVGLMLGVVADSSAAQGASLVPEGPGPVRLVLPYGAAGVVDINARALARELTDIWGRPVVVENKPGAAGLIAAEYVVKAPPDGRTLLVVDDGVLVSMPFFQRKMPYDTLNDLVAVGLVGQFPYLLVVHSALRATTLSELVALARAKPGSLDYATNGVGGTQHLAVERLQRTLGISLNHVPFKSAAPALQEVLAGRVPVMLVAVATATPVIQDGRLVPLATGGSQRASSLPQVPTVAESGYPGFEVVGWVGALAPRGTPAAIVEGINADITRAIQRSSYRESLAQRGSEARSSTPRELAQRIRFEYERTGALVKSLGLTPD